MVICQGAEVRYKACTLEQIEAELNDNIVFTAQYLRDLAGNPSIEQWIS